MIPAIATALAVPPAAGGAPAASSDGDAGLSFGNAVKDAGRDHAERDGKAHDKTTDAKTKDAKSGEADGGARTERKRTRSAGDEKTTADGEGAAAVSPMDILGKLLGVAGPRDVAAGEGESHGKSGDGDGDDDGQLQERLVISTVMDLAGDMEPKATTTGQVSLRVLKMETHFEPRLDGATLVEPEKAVDAVRDVADALAGGVSPKDSADNGKTVRKNFDEILQGLGRPSAETPAGEADGGGEPGEDRRGESRAASIKAADKAASADTARSFAPAKAVDKLAEPVSSATGQIHSTQVAGRIVEAFGPERTDAGRSAGASDAQNGQLLRMTAGGAALKTLSIQLQPQDLGRLDVSMRLVDGRLSVELAASEPSTAQALTGDRHTLRKLLEHAGFALDDAAITIVTRDVAQIAQSASSGNTPGDGQGGGAERGQDRAFEGHGSGGQGSASGGQRGEAKPEEPPERRQARVAGNVFL